jgi:hypothetical protein
LPPTQSTLFMEKGGGCVVIWEFAMSIGPHNKQNLLLRGADNVLPSPHRGDDEFFDVLGPALEEVAGLQRDESPHQETNDLLLLLEENARLRKLAVQLSNLLGDISPFSFPATPTGGQMRPSLDQSVQRRARNG